MDNRRYSKFNEFPALKFPAATVYNKSLRDWSLRKQLILLPLNLNVSLGSLSGNIEILRKQN